MLKSDCPEDCFPLETDPWRWLGLEEAEGAAEPMQHINMSGNGQPTDPCKVIGSENTTRITNYI